MPRRGWAVGVDFGGTNIKAGLVSRRGEVAASRLLSSSAYGSPSRFIGAVRDTAASMAREAGLRMSRLDGIGVGVPGPIDARRGTVRMLVNVPGWRDVPLQGRLERASGVRCLVDNDANAVTLGEWRFGAGRGSRQLLGVTLGTGVGGGLVLDGSVYRGASGSAGELGHTVIVDGGERCHCGSRGCLEAYVGTAAILRLARAALRRSRGCLRPLAAQGRLTPALVSEAARRGDPAAKRLWEEIGRRLGIGLSSAVNLLNPDRIVIGGGIANAWAFFAPALRRTLHRQALPAAAQRVRVARARLGNHAGIVGAAVLVWNAIEGRGARGVGRGRGA
jgi:glucokinase